MYIYIYCIHIYTWHWHLNNSCPNITGTSLWEQVIPDFKYTVCFVPTELSKMQRHFHRNGKFGNFVLDVWIFSFHQRVAGRMYVRRSRSLVFNRIHDTLCTCALSSRLHDDIKTLKCFPYYRPFVKGIRQWIPFKKVQKSRILMPIMLLA